MINEWGGLAAVRTRGAFREVAGVNEACDGLTVDAQSLGDDALRHSPTMKCNHLTVAILSVLTVD
jgi:hypothetical protein